MEKQATGAKQHSYTQGYKRQVVDWVVGTGRTATAVAAEVGVHATVLCRWVKPYAPGHGTSEALRPLVAPSLKPLPVPTADQAAEIARPKRENERPRMERDISKESIGIFAVPSR